MSGNIEVSSNKSGGHLSIPPDPSGAGAAQGMDSSAGGSTSQSAQPEPRNHEPEKPYNRPWWEATDDPGHYWRDRKTFFTDEEHREAWNATAEIVKTYSDEMIDRWNKEIDTLLVYAGLFSAILTAFNVQSYQLLTPPPQTDPVIVALERISAQLSSFSVNPPSVNSTYPAFVVQDSTPPPAPRWAVWLNIVWFSSLIFSLSAASVGIMVKQWLNEYNSGLLGTSRQTARLRQLRLKSLERWHVKEIVGILPVLLQVASALFFTGLLVLLWQLNRTVAVVGTVLVGMLVTFSLGTIIIPSFTTHCSYVSPSSRALHDFMQQARQFFHRCWYQLSFWVGDHCYPLGRHRRPHLDPWGSTFARTFRKWRWSELHLLNVRAKALDGDMIATAYKSSMDNDYLRHAAVCATALLHNDMRTCFEAIHSANYAHWGSAPAAEVALKGFMGSVHPCIWSGTIISLMRTEWLPAGSAIASDIAYSFINFRLQSLQSDTSRTRLFCADLARIIRHYDRHVTDTLNMKSALLTYGLLETLKSIAEMNLGNDVRQYVASICVDEALKGLAGIVVDDSDARKAFRSALGCLVACVPAPESSDWKPADPEYQRLRSQLDRASNGIAEYLSTSGRRERTIEWLELLFGWLCKDGERVGVLSPELKRASIDYLEAYEIEHHELPRRLDDCLSDFYRMLSDSSGQDAIAACILRRTDGLLSAGAPALAVGGNVQQFLVALRRIIRCTPSQRLAGCTPDHPEYEVLRARAVSALHIFSTFLSSPESREKKHAESIHYVFNALRVHESPRGFMSVELRDAILRYWDAYWKAIPRSTFNWTDYPATKEWIRSLQRDVGNHTQDSQQLTSRPY